MALPGERPHTGNRLVLIAVKNQNPHELELLLELLPIGMGIRTAVLTEHERDAVGPRT
jgi:hypothetical protein